MPGVVFVNPPGPPRLYRSAVCTFVSKANYLWEPQDFVTMSAHVPPATALGMLDCSRSGLDAQTGLARLKAIEPDALVVAISSIVLESDLEFLASLRTTFPSAPLLVLGDALLEPVFWERVARHATHLVLNPMEPAIRDALEGRASDAPGLIPAERAHERVAAPQPSAPRAVSIGQPRHEAFLDGGYRFPFAHALHYATITGQFGCPFQCRYCSWCKTPVTYRGYEELVEEARRVRALGIREVFWGDPSFGFPRDNASAMLDELIRAGLGLSWSCYGNPQLLNDDTLSRMRKAGCHTIIIGVDDADTDMLKERYQRSLTRDDLYRFCSTCHKLGIEICGDFIIILLSFIVDFI